MYLGVSTNQKTKNDYLNLEKKSISVGLKWETMEFSPNISKCL